MIESYSMPGVRLNQFLKMAKIGLLKNKEDNYYFILTRQQQANHYDHLGLGWCLTIQHPEKISKQEL